MSTDHVAVGLSRVVEFQEHQNFIAFLTGLMGLANELESCFQQMSLLPSIDDMTGVNLDTIGIIVGVSRNVSGVVTLTWFGFADTGGYATCFGEEGIPNIGARFFEEGEVLSSTTILEDVEYRLILKAKIVKNNSSCTPEDILAGLRFIFNTLDVQITDNSLDPVTPRQTISLSIGRPVYAFEQAIITALDILPRPAGISIEGSLGTFTAPAPGYTGGLPPYDPDGA